MKKKILFVAAESAYGMIPFAATIINSISSSELFDVKCICLNSDDRTYNKYIGEHVDVKFVELPSNIIQKVLFKFWPRRIIKEIEKCDKEFHPNYIHFLTGDFVMANYVSLKNDSRFCYTVHDLHPHEAKFTSIAQFILYKMINCGYKRCMNNINILTTSSLAQCNELRNMFPNKNCIYTPFPTLVTDEIACGEGIIQELVNFNNYILFFGGVKTYKGIDMLMEAYKICKERMQNIPKLVIAGKGKDYSNIDKNIIHLNRFIRDDEIKYLFEKAQLVVYPYISATMSGVLSIAHFFRKQVLLSDLPFFMENRSAYCIYFKTGNLNSLVNELEKSLSINYVENKNDDAYSRLYSKDSLISAYSRLYSSK